MLRATILRFYRLFRRYPLTWLCILLTCYLCLFKPPRIHLVEDIFGFDKVVHAAMYFGTCSVLWWEYLRIHLSISRRKLLAWAVAAPIAMSGIVELAQEFLTTTRTGDWADLLANSVGVVAAAFFGRFVLRRFVHPHIKK